MKYTAISIGPIIATFSQVRKPRHLWSASFIFSHLMSKIIEQGKNNGGILISPAETENKKSGIGLYPDRAFFKGEIDIKSITNSAFNALITELNNNDNPFKIEGVKRDKFIFTKQELADYFNVMGLIIEEDTESKAILLLNRKLDVLELANRCENSDVRKKVIDFIMPGHQTTGTFTNSSLYNLAFGKSDFPINSLDEYAAIQLKTIDEAYWKKVVNICDEDDTKDFLEELFKENKIRDSAKSYHKYFCVVQADGDNMGKVIENLQENKLNCLSESLLTFGKNACGKIKEFGGLPIYAGGDDLLFIAPVVSDKGNIFDLINCIDKEYEKVQSKAIELQDDKKKQTTSMSYGIAISYYKYPLYEAFESARNLLFEVAKDQTGKNALACELRKHSGSSFSVVYSKSDIEIKKHFETLLKISVGETLVSVVSHKLRENSVLWQATKGDEKRIDAFFKNMMGLGEKKNEQNNYLETVRSLVFYVLNKHNLLIKQAREKFSNEMQELINNNTIQQQELDQAKEYVKKRQKKHIEFIIENMNQTIYSMLRTAKFINGEEVKE